MKSASSKRIETLTISLAIGMVAGGALNASAQGRQDRDADRSVESRQEQSGRPQQREQGERQAARADGEQRGMQQDDSRRHAPAMVRASKLLDMKVQGPDGQELGDVDEIILSEDRRSVEHIAVSLDDGEILMLSLDELSAKPGDDDVVLVKPSTRVLLQRQSEVQDQAWGEREQDVHESRRVSKLIGLDVQGTDGKDVGSIDDLIIDIQNGNVETAAIQTGGFLGIGRRLASVDWQQVHMTGDGETASIGMTKDQLSERAHRRSAYWDRHAFGRDDGQYGRDRQLSGQRERTASSEPRRDRDARQTSDGTAQADNTGRNVRDRDGATLTSFDQGNSKADVDTTAKIRKEVNASENMSVSAKNVKIITRDGQVTLRGPVASEQEKRIIGEIANRIARAGNVDNQLEVIAAGTASSH